MPDFSVSPAPVSLGGRSLTVRDCTFWDLEAVVEPFQKAVAQPGLGARIIDILEYFVGHNEGVDREFIKKAVPANIKRCMDLLLSVLEASGLERVKSGEAAPAQ